MPLVDPMPVVDPSHMVDPILKIEIIPISAIPMEY